MEAAQYFAFVRQPWQLRRALVAIPLVLIVAISVADVCAPPDVHLSPLLVVAPAITTAFAGYRLTALIGALAVGAHRLIDELQIGLAEDRYAQLVGLALLSIIATLMSFARDRNASELAQVRSVAETAQQALLRPLPDRLGPLRIASSYLAAAKQAAMGGDLYAAARIDGRTRVIIGDVRGKGLAAVGEAAMLLGAFREATHRYATLPALAEALDRSICRHLTEFPETDEEAEEHFITALLVELSDHSPVVRMINCGHPPPLLVRRGQVRCLSCADPAPPLGMWGLAPDDHPTYSFCFQFSDSLLLYTDGVVEARDRDRNFYPLEQRIAFWTRSSPKTLVQHIERDLSAHCHGALCDDAAVLALQRTPPPRLGLHLGDLVTEAH
ncbi:PP2C family protein-serine/threonine phosphatase [Streptomyces nodosus]|uniref:PP2C family protein-serine/threonine phosphatase n=1 Tax=Streptomyces nodosus TaxID=40318 RepID=UPI0037FC666F